jgi:short-subunit dehydrogenase
MASIDLSVLNAQRVLITGAACGIGAALAEQLASHGARLALVGLEPETMEAVVPESLREYDRMVEERGESGAAATERTRELAGL